MGLKTGVVRAAVVQAAPAIMDKKETLKIVRKLAFDAAGQGAKIILFPEAFIPCYPRGLTFGTVVGNRSPEGRKDFARYYENSIDVPGPEAEELGEIAAKCGAYLSIGVMERDGGTLYCTLLYYGPGGDLLAKHRKLLPTGASGSSGARGRKHPCTVDTPYGVMSGLICWENYMPLARTALYGRNTSIYLAPTADQREIWQSSMRHIALEGGASSSRATSSSRRTCTPAT